MSIFYHKFLQKMSKNHLTKRDKCDKIDEYLLGSDTSNGNQARKKLKKDLKKYFTNGNKCGILTKLSARAGSKRTLKIEQRKTRKQRENSIERY